jgi:hypothetical protein
MTGHLRRGLEAAPFEHVIFSTRRPRTEFFCSRLKFALDCADLPRDTLCWSQCVDAYSHSPVESAGVEKTDRRYFPRFKLETEIRIYPRNSGAVRGHTVDISESGIAAMLQIEVLVGELVRLEFSLPVGHVDVLALGRRRHAFRYGFQFVEFAHGDAIGIACRQLAVEQELRKSAAASR